MAKIIHLTAERNVQRIKCTTEKCIDICVLVNNITYYLPIKNNPNPEFISLVVLNNGEILKVKESIDEIGRQVL